jgi:hypothetical protein
MPATACRLKRFSSLRDRLQPEPKSKKKAGTAYGDMRFRREPAEVEGTISPGRTVETTDEENTMRGRLNAA